MKIKYRSGYAEGGFLDDGASVDPVSGNEVPTGSLAEEVRDDVPAQLSEGEFVVPADVVRYIGLEKLMQMRDQAKSGLAEMEQEGQMGGSPAPAPEMQMQPEMSGGMEDIDIDAMIDGMEDGGVQNFDEGGFVQRDDGSWQFAGPTEADGFEGANYSDLMGSNFGTVPTTETMTYINEEGYKIYIPIIDGKPAYQPPEGFTLFNDSSKEDGGVLDPVDDSEQDLAEAMQTSTTDSPSRDFVQSGDRERQELEIVSSDRLGRDRLQNLKSQAKSNMTQDEVDGIWNQMTQQEKSIYEDRMKDPKFLDGVLIPDDTAPVDRMLLAIQTANAINTRKGLSLNKSQTSTYSDEPVDFKKMAKVIGGAIFGGIPGFLTAAKVGELGIDSDEVLAAAKEFVLSGVGQGSGRTGDEGTQPPASTPTEYNQKYWRENFYDEKNGSASSAEIAAEQLRIAMETGKGAYGNDLTPEQIKAVNKAAREKDLADKAERTIAERKAKADEAASLNKQEQDRAAANAQALALDKARKDQAAIDAAEAAALAAQNNLPPSPTRGGSTVNSGNDNNGPKGNNSGPVGGSTSGPKSRGGRQRQQRQRSGPQAGQTMDYAQGGLASKIKPEVMKMRNDPTSGLAAKKKSKQKAQAKKGALAAKRT